MPRITILLNLLILGFVIGCSSTPVSKHISGLAYLTDDEKILDDQQDRNPNAKVVSAMPQEESVLDEKAAENAGPVWKSHGSVNSLSFGDDEARDIHVDYKGKMLVVGSSLTADNFFDFVLMSYHQDGSKDHTFGKEGKATVDFKGAADHANTIAIQADGKILIAGYTKSKDKDFAIARFMPNGSLDLSFGDKGRVVTDFKTYQFPRSGEESLQEEMFGSKSDDVVNDIDIRSDGRIIVAGYATGGVVRKFALAQYLPNGSPDLAFGKSGKLVHRVGLFDEEIKSIMVQPDGKVVAAGSSEYNYPGKSYFLLTRYLEDGKLDKTFGDAGSVVTAIGQRENVIAAATLQNDGKIVVAGHSSSLLGGYDFAVARYKANGALDTAFGEEGSVLKSLGGNSSQATGVSIQADGKIVVAGTVTAGFTQQVALMRLNHKGKIDADFGSAGVLNSRSLTTRNQDQAHAVALQADGSIVVVGQSQNEGYGSDCAMIRYSAE